MKIEKNFSGNPKNRFTRHRHFRSGDYRRALVLPVDRRIHFALSYLNQSSPGIRIYNAQSIDEELQVAGELFLQNHMGINVEGGEVTHKQSFLKKYLFITKVFTTRLYYQECLKDIVMT